MAEMAGTSLNPMLAHRPSETRMIASIHPAWLHLMRYCAELGHGEIEKLKIQDGVPVIADVVREKVKFS
jgi:hypothetical protein